MVIPALRRVTHLDEILQLGQIIGEEDTPRVTRLSHR